MTLQAEPQVWTALVTPFNEDGQIDWASFEKLVEKQVSAGVTGLALSGTTGEAPALGMSEKISLVKRAKELCGDQLKLMVGTGSNNTEASVELSCRVCEAGADSLLVVTPPYNKPSLSGLVKHFDCIARASEAPICLYHVPGRTAHHLSSQEMKAITEVEGVNSIKEASADLALFSRVIQDCPGVQVLTGDDPTYLASLAVGGQGAVSVLTNAFPKAFVALSKAFHSGDMKKAQFLHKAFFPMMEANFCETNPGPLKAVLSLLGLCQNTVRLPLAPVSQESMTFLKKTLEELQVTLEGLAS